MILKKIKEKTQLSEVQLAQSLGVSQPTVNRILAGQSDCKGKTYQAILGLHARVFSDVSPVLPPSCPKIAPCQSVI